MSEKPPILMQRRGDFLAPHGPIDGERVRELPAGKVLKVVVTQPRRSLPQLRLYWSLLRLVCDNLDQDIEPDQLHQWLKLRLGMTTEIKLRSGEIVTLPKSIAFDKLEHAEMTAYMDKVKELVVRKLIPGLGKEALERAALEMLGEPIP